MSHFLQYLSLFLSFSSLLIFSLLYYVAVCNIYIYIYICVCVCVGDERERERERERAHYEYTQDIKREY